MKIVIVGFKLTEENSVFYKKIDMKKILLSTFLDIITKAIDKSDFISIRIVRK